MLFQIVRGWRLGLPRQLVRIGAIVAAYSAALFGGGILLPLLRPLIKVPDFIISALGGVILALLVYSLVNTIGTILFKRTGQQGSGLVRLVYGVSGAVLGNLFRDVFSLAVDHGDSLCGRAGGGAGECERGGSAGGRG